MPRSGSGDWCVYIRIENHDAIRVYFQTEEDAIAAARDLAMSVEAARSENRTIAFFNGGRTSVDARRYVSAEVLTAGQDPDTPYGVFVSNG